MKELKNKVAVITGAASGIGLALARRAASEGMKLVIADIELDALSHTADELRAGGAHVVSLVVDVGRAEQVAELAALAKNTFGAVHLLANNAGVGGGGRCWELELDYWEWVLRVNLWGVIHGVKYFTPLLVAQNEGHIVNTASIAGLMSAPDTGPYTVSKHAVVALSEVLQGDLRRAGADGVGVSVLCPSFVDTRIYAAERNRPLSDADRRDPERRQQQKQIEELGAAFFSTAMSSDHVADQVFQAVRDRQFYILTHPDGSRRQIARRMQTMLDNGTPDVSGPEEFPLV